MIPIAVPILASLAMAVLSGSASDPGSDRDEGGGGSSGEGDGEEGWKFEIPDEYFRLVGEGSPAAIEFDLVERTISAARARPRLGQQVQIVVDEAYRTDGLREAFEDPEMLERLEELRRAYLADEEHWEWKLDGVKSLFWEARIGKYLDPLEFVMHDVHGDIGALQQVTESLVEMGRDFFRHSDYENNLCVGTEGEEDDAIRMVVFEFLRSRFGASRRQTHLEGKTDDRRDYEVSVRQIDSEEDEVRRIMGLPSLGFEIWLEPLEEDPEDPSQQIYSPVDEQELAEIVEKLGLQEADPPDDWNRAYVLWVPDEGSVPATRW